MSVVLYMIKFLSKYYDDQGLIGAFVQYFTVEDKARLHRRNTYFEDHMPSLKTSNRFYIGLTMVALAIAFGLVI